MTTNLASLLLGGTTVIAAAIVGYAVLKKMILLLSTENAENGKHQTILDGCWLVPALCICGYDAFISVRRWVAIAAMVILVLVRIDERRYRSPQDCSTRLVQDALTRFLDHPNDATMALNCAYQRDPTRFARSSIRNYPNAWRNRATPIWFICWAKKKPITPDSKSWASSAFSNNRARWFI